MTALRPTVARSIMFACMVAASACTVSQTDVPERLDDLQRFGFAVGDSIAPFSVDCLTAGSRRIGLPGSTQVVTFSTPGDCSTCMLHLAGLDSVALSGRGPADNVIVTFTPGQSPASVARLYGSRLVRDVCVDTSGFAWDALNMQKTPVTALLISGRVAYVTNGGLLSDSSRTRFLKQLDNASRAAAPQ